jgi:L-asparaginase II
MTPTAIPTVVIIIEAIAICFAVIAILVAIGRDRGSDARRVIGRRLSIDQVVECV